jgi:NAD(P)-dependent dehydrogenase (short-subunit alcohol dehydrogenase family)
MTALAGKRALVTGATRGIGRAIALALAEQGCDVIAIGRSQDALAEIGKIPRITAKRCDVTSEADIHQLFADLKGKRLDFLINNAGSAHALKNVGELSLDEWTRTLETTLTSMFHVTSHALAAIPQGGVIVNVLSVAAYTPFVGMAAYNAAKAGALAFTNTLREEVRAKGIRVCALVPGATATDIWQQFWPEAPQEKMITPQEVARTVVHVCSLPPEANIDELKILPAAGTL